MMKRFIVVGLLFVLCACVGVDVPDQFTYQEIQANDFKIASWQKISNPQSWYKVYIEGDGYAFNRYGQPTSDPTPRGTLMRELAFGDNNPNVIYLARPCQYVMSSVCSQKYWTTARFAPEVILAEYDAIKQIVGNSPVILVGFSGGAQVAGLVASAQSGLNIKKIITIAGNLDHHAWTDFHNLPSLDESMNLENYHTQFMKIPQIHYAGSDDEVIPPLLIKNFVGQNTKVITVNGATHNTGWKNIYTAIQQEK